MRTFTEEVSQAVGKRISHFACQNTISEGDFYLLTLYFTDGSSLEIRHAPEDGYILRAAYEPSQWKE